MKSSIALGILVFLLWGAPAQAQSMVPYANRELGFEISYPADYQRIDLPCDQARSFVESGLESLLYLQQGKGCTMARIRIYLDRRPFSMATLVLRYSRATEEPQQLAIAGNTLYYYGRGGGGVAYPDDYLYNLDGYILLISFDGPYPSDSNWPSAETKKMEKVVLQSFHRSTKD